MDLKNLTIPGFIQMREELLKRKQEIEAGVLPLMQERDKLKEKIRPTEDRIRALNEDIKKFRGGESGNELFDVTQAIAGLSRAIGGSGHRSIQAESVQQEVPAEKPQGE